MKKLSGKITCFILTAALLFSVSGCGSPGERGTADKSGTAQGEEIRLLLERLVRM